MKLKFKHGMMAILAVSLGACASTKTVEPVVEKKSEFIPAPQAPSVVTPAPTQPVQRAPIADVNPGPPVPTAGSVAHFKYSAGDDRVYFGYNQYSLSAQSKDVLRQQATWLKTYDSAIVVVGGNADERGTREYNLALGARRAQAVKSFLIAQGIAPKRVTTVSYGKERPINGGSNEGAWAMNRNAHSSVVVGRRS